VAISSVLNPGTIVRERPATALAAQNFITGGSPLGEGIVASAANKIVGFQRGAAAVAARPPDLQGIIQTLSTSILNNVENRVQSINQNVVQRINETIGDLSSKYTQRLDQIDAARPNSILQNFLNLYREAIGYIQFLGNRRNVRTLGDNLKALQNVFAETFNVAKIIRQTIIRIVKQLSNLPAATSGGGGLNLDIDIPGGSLRRGPMGGISRMMRRRPGMMLGGAALAGGLGSQVVSGMLDVGGGVQAAPMAEGTIPGSLLDRFSGILDRFAAAINSLGNQRPAASASKSTPSAPPEKEKPKESPGGVPGGPAGSVTATGSEQQKTEALIAGEEGVRTQAYQNPGDVPTIGYGQTKINGRAVKLGDTMTKEQAVVGLRQNIESHRAVAVRDIGKESWDNIKDENAKAALTSLAYNYGHIPKVVIPAAKSGDPKKISDAIRSLATPGTPGYDSRLTGRRNREADFILTGSSPRLDKDFLAGGKLAAPSSAVSTATAQPPSRVAPASGQQQTAQQVAQTVAQPPPQQQTQVTVAPMNMASPQTQSTKVGDKAIPPPVMNKGGVTVPFLSSSNNDNFLTLYSKIVYNIVDG
jgi:GH24 family phage-related lysozyme (muramidase)